MLALHGEFCLLCPKFNCDNPHNNTNNDKKKINRRKGEKEKMKAREKRSKKGNKVEEVKINIIQNVIVHYLSKTY